MSTTLTISTGTLVVGDIVPFSPIQSVTCGSTGSPGTVVRDSAWTVVMATGNPRCQLSTAFQANDRVELFTDVASYGSNAVQVSSATEYIVRENGPPHTLALGIPITLRKISSFEWVVTP